jgi:hypothetical protein
VTPSSRMSLVLLGTAALSAVTIASAADPGVGAGLALGFAAYLLLVVWSVLARARRAAAAEPPARLGALALAGGLALALVDRHQVVASRGLAPDDVAVGLFGAAAIGLAAAAPRLAARPLVIGLALAAYALVGVSLVAGTRYHSDAVANVHRGTELLLAGADPYRAVDTYESLDRFGMDRELATHLEDGTALRSFNYPALALLVPAPAVALGLADLRVLYLGEILVAALAATAVAAPPWRPFVLAAVVGNVVIARQHVLAGIDPAWAILLGAALVVLGRAERRRSRRLLWLSAVLLGLAAASRQPAWFAAPFALAAVWRDWGAPVALRYAVAAAAAFVVPALPFLVAAPAEHLAGVLTPIVLPLEPHGVGLARLGAEGLAPLLPRGAHAALALAALALALAAALRRRATPVAYGALAVAPLYLAWRALQNYFAFAGPFAALAVADEDADGTRSAARTGPGGR